MPGIGRFTQGAQLEENTPLGQFILAAKRKEISGGTVLLVEYLDRLTRQEVDIAISVISQLIRLGIVIHVIAPSKQQVYDMAALKDAGKLLTMVCELLAAFNEVENRKGKIQDGVDALNTACHRGWYRRPGPLPPWLWIKDRDKSAGKDPATRFLLEPGSYALYDDRADIMRWLVRQSGIQTGPESL